MSKYTAERVLEYVEKAERGYFNPVHMEMLRDYAALLRERESAKAAVTDEMVQTACASLGIPPCGDDPFIDVNDVRAALEAVAPMLASIQSPDMVCEQHPWSEWPHDDCAGPGMPGTTQYEALVYLAKLASARVPDETGWLIESAFNGFSPSWWGGVPEGCGQSFTANPNKAVRFCRKDDAEAVAKHMHMVIVTEHKWLAAAPKPVEMNGWSPIESAPQGEDVLTWAETIIPYAIECMDKNGNWERNDPKPTHWMPIPKGPKPETKE